MVIVVEAIMTISQQQPKALISMIDELMRDVYRSIVSAVDGE